MKKFLILPLLLLLLNRAEALPVGNPADPSLYCRGWFSGQPCEQPTGCWWRQWSARVGFYGDYVLNRHLKTADLGSSDDETRLSTNAALLVVNLMQRVDVFATLGTTSIESSFVDFPSPSGFPHVGFLELDSNNSFSWSVGGRGVLYRCGILTLGCEGQYFRCAPLLTRLWSTLNNDRNQVFMATPTHYDEWQVGLALSAQLRRWVPYVGVKWSQAHWHLGNPVILSIVPPVTLPNLKNQKHWGYALGLTLMECEVISFTIEGRFADERALHLNAQIRF